MDSLKKYINKEVGLEVINKAGEKVGPAYKTKIIEVLDTKDINILIPSFDKYAVPLPIDTKVRIFLKSILEGDNFVNGVIVSRFNKGNQILLRVRKDIEKPKKEKNVFSIKTDCDLKAEYGQTDLSENHGFKPARVIKISADSLNSLVNEDVNIGNSVEIYIWISERKIVNAVCNVVKKREVTSKEGFKYELDLEFTEISEADRDIIIKYTFKKQKEYIRGMHA